MGTASTFDSKLVGSKSGRAPILSEKFTEEIAKLYPYECENICKKNHYQGNIFYDKQKYLHHIISSWKLLQKQVG